MTEEAGKTKAAGGNQTASENTHSSDDTKSTQRRNPAAAKQPAIHGNATDYRQTYKGVVDELLGWVRLVMIADTPEKLESAKTGLGYWELRLKDMNDEADARARGESRAPLPEYDGTLDAQIRRRGHE